MSGEQQAVVARCQHCGAVVAVSYWKDAQESAQRWVSDGHIVSETTKADALKAVGESKTCVCGDPDALRSKVNRLSALLRECLPIIEAQRTSVWSKHPVHGWMGMPHPAHPELVERIRAEAGE